MARPTAKSLTCGHMTALNTSKFTALGKESLVSGHQPPEEVAGHRHHLWPNFLRRRLLFCLSPSTFVAADYDPLSG